jgi:enamine deaminase RidA (YjgF/YER057c/UK114 family)
MGKSKIISVIGVTIIALLNFITISKAQNPEKRLKELKLSVPKPVTANNSYVGAVRSGNLIFLSGKGPRSSGGAYVTGKLGREMQTADGAAAAKLIALAQIGELKEILGDLSKVRRIVKVNGFVNSTADFSGQSIVLDGFSDLIVAVFGEKGKHARTSVGVASLPLNMAVEIEMIVEVEP